MRVRIASLFAILSLVFIAACAEWAWLAWHWVRGRGARRGR